MNGYQSTLHDAIQGLGGRARALRLTHELSQGALASRAGVALSTVRRFETTGVASLENVLRIPTALHAEEPFSTLFAAPAYASLDDAIARTTTRPRQRAPRRR